MLPVFPSNLAPLPLSGFAIYPDRLLLQGGTPMRVCFCDAAKLNADAYKQFLSLLEQSLGAQRNELAKTDPASVSTLLRVIVLFHRDKPPDQDTGAVLAFGIDNSSSGFLALWPVLRNA